VAVLPLVERGEIVQRTADIRMTRRKCLLADRKRPPEQRLGLGITLLALIERAEIVELWCDCD
jgi:hypothetical protein